MWKFLQHFSHLVAAFTATNVDDHLCVRPFRNTVLGNCLTRTERTRNTGRATFGYGEEGIQNALTRNQWDMMPKPPDKWARPANGPALEHRQFFFLFLLANFESGDGLSHGILTIRGDPGDCACIIWVNHDAMF